MSRRVDDVLLGYERLSLRDKVDFLAAVYPDVLELAAASAPVKAVTAKRLGFGDAVPGDPISPWTEANIPQVLADMRDIARGHRNRADDLKREKAGRKRMPFIAERDAKVIELKKNGMTQGQIVFYIQEHHPGWMATERRGKRRGKFSEATVKEILRRARARGEL